MFSIENWTHPDDMPKIWQNLKNINQSVSNRDPRDASASKKECDLPLKKELGITTAKWTIVLFAGSPPPLRLTIISFKFLLRFQS